MIPEKPSVHYNKHLYRRKEHTIFNIQSQSKPTEHDDTSWVLRKLDTERKKMLFSMLHSLRIQVCVVLFRIPEKLKLSPLVDGTSVTVHYNFSGSIVFFNSHMFYPRM